MFIYFFLVTLLSPMFTITTPSSFKKVSAFFGSLPYEEILQKKYNVAKQSTIIIENIDGPITITTSWKKNTVFLKTIKKSSKPELLPTIQTITKQPASDKLMIKTAYDQSKTKGLVEYELIVPSNVSLQISTQQGMINIKEIQGPIVACTNQGDIAITKTKNTVSAKTKKTGSIRIDQAKGPINAATHHGSITIDHSYQSILATADKGHISVNCNKIPSTSSIHLKTKSGPITLALPTQTNASLKGRTSRGTITSNHYITLKPCTTKLNNLAWSRFKKEVDGILGTGEAEINCFSNYGNIKIIEAITV